MSFPRYPQYKDSGVEWLGEVPAHWQIEAIKRQFEVVGGATPKSDVESYWQGDIPWATPADLSDRVSIYINDTQRRITEDGLNSCGAQLAPPRSIILSTRAPIGSLAISEVPISTNQGCKTLVPVSGADPEFFTYFLLTSKNALNVRGKGTTFLELSGDELRGFQVLVPTRDEQRNIATFLDRETTKIDALIAEQERLMELLTAKRQAVISHAVTKGLNPDAPMKDSGVEWLGEVPAHWEVAALKRSWRVLDCKHITAEFGAGSYPVASIREVQSWWIDLATAKLTTREFYEELIDGDRKPEPGDLIFSRNATVGEVAQVRQDHVDFAMGQDVVLLRRESPSTSSDFLQHVLRSPVVTQQLAVLMIGSTFKRINVEEIRSILVPSPPTVEQQQIALYLQAEVNEFSSLESGCVSAIALLGERRSALISAAVTGQIDVRELANTEYA